MKSNNGFFPGSCRAILSRSANRRAAAVLLAGIQLLAMGLGSPNLYAATNAAAQQRVHLAVMPHSSAERDILYQLVEEFRGAHPSLQVQITAYSPADYKDKVAAWLETGETPADVLQWFAGERLRQFVDRGRLANVATSVLEGNFDPKMLKLVKAKDRFYALPMNYYQWGIYSNQTQVDALPSALPDTLEEVPDYCQRVRETGRYAFAIGGRDPWAVAGWFDYLNLRLNGLEFHQALLDGQGSFASPQVIGVFEFWEKMRKAECFYEPITALGWSETLPYLYRGKVLHMLMGNFLMAAVPEQQRRSLSFTPFPRSKRLPEYYEDMPVDVLMIPADTSNPEAAGKLLAFFAQPAVQARLAKAMYKIPAHPSAEVSNDAFIQAGVKLKQQAAGISQFFDRDTPAVFSEPAMQIIVDWLQGSEDRSTTLQRLDRLRSEALAQSDR